MDPWRAANQPHCRYALSVVLVSQKNQPHRVTWGAHLCTDFSLSVVLSWDLFIESCIFRRGPRKRSPSISPQGTESLPLPWKYPHGDHARRPPFPLYPGLRSPQRWCRSVPWPRWCGSPRGRALAPTPRHLHEPLRSPRPCAVRVASYPGGRTGTVPLCGPGAQQHLVYPSRLCQDAPAPARATTRTIHRRHVPQARPWRRSMEPSVISQYPSTAYRSWPTCSAENRATGSLWTMTLRTGPRLPSVTWLLAKAPPDCPTRKSGVSCSISCSNMRLHKRHGPRLLTVHAVLWGSNFMIPPTGWPTRRRRAIYRWHPRQKTSQERYSTRSCSR